MTRRSLFGALLAALLAPFVRLFGEREESLRLVGHVSNERLQHELRKQIDNMSMRGTLPRTLYHASPNANRTHVAISYAGTGDDSIEWRGRVIGEIERDELHSDLIVRHAWDDDDA